MGNSSKFEYMAESSPLCEVCRTVGRGPVFYHQFTAICADCFRGMVDVCPDEVLKEMIGPDRLMRLAGVGPDEKLPFEPEPPAPPTVTSTITPSLDAAIAAAKASNKPAVHNAKAKGGKRR